MLESFQQGPHYPSAVQRQEFFEPSEMEANGLGDISETSSHFQENIFSEEKPRSDFQIFNHTQNSNGSKHVITHDQTARFLQIPNFIEAILALLISGLLLAACLLIIKKTKAWCLSRNKQHKDVETPVVETKVKEPPPIVPVPSTSKQEKEEIILEETNKRVPASPDSESQQETGTSGHSIQKPSRKSQRCKDRPAFERRVSGPFGDEAMAHVEETYRGAKHYEEKQSSWARRVSTRRGPSSIEKKDQSNLPIHS